MTAPDSGSRAPAKPDNWHPMQGWVDHMSALWQKERREIGMTLGSLIAVLSALPQDRRIVGIGWADSYRGYYCDLAFEPDEKERTVADLLHECREAMGHVFTGYKGGDYLMGETTPVWISGYGEASGLRLVGLASDEDPIRPVTHNTHDDD